MHKILKSNKTPQSLWGFVLLLALVSSVLSLAGCNAQKENLKIVENPRYSFSYNPDVLESKMTTKDEYSFGLKDSGKDFEATLNVFVPTEIKEEFEGYYETAKLDFLTSFDKILNQKESKSQLKGITTGVLVVTAQKDLSSKPWSGMLKLSVVKDGLLIMKVTCSSTIMEKHRKDINKLFESTVLKGKDD